MLAHYSYTRLDVIDERVHFERRPRVSHKSSLIERAAATLATTANRLEERGISIEKVEQLAEILVD